MTPSLSIAARFCGPAFSGNGGYSCGLLAQRVPGGGPVEVTLRAPPPLDRAMSLRPRGTGDDSEMELRDGERLIAEARPATLELALPEPPGFAEAEALSALYVGHQQHYFPTCFVCGPQRRPGDGLRIFPGALPGAGAAGQPVVAPFVPDASLADASGLVLPEMIWAALDCPGYFGAGAPDYPMALLGRMTAVVEGAVQVGERCVVMGWGLGREGRKLLAATALFGADGSPRGRARQTWIMLA